MLRELCDKVEIFNIYYSDVQGLIPKIREASLQISRALLSFLSYTVAFIRSYDVLYSNLGQCELASLPLVIPGLINL